MGNKKIKVSPNPMIAYQQGFTEGNKVARAQDIHRGINLAYAYMLLAMAYTNEKDDGTTYLSKPKFREFYQIYAETLQKFVNDSIEGEEGIDTCDIADLYVGHDSTVRERYGLPKKEYYNIEKRDEVL